VFSVGGGRIISFAARNVASRHSPNVASSGGGMMLIVGESNEKSAMKEDGNRKKMVRGHDYDPRKSILKCGPRGVDDEIFDA